MASIISAGTTSATALNMSADTSGVLQLASNNGVVALTVSSSQGIGIGTDSPTAQLEISRSATNAYSTMRLSNTGASGKTYEIGLGGNTAASGYANNLYFYDSTAGAVRMAITSAGYVTTPSQPAFRAALTNTSNYTTTGSDIPFNSVAFNTGSHYDSSTGVFTAPVAGVYVFFVRTFVEVLGRCSTDIRVNGTAVISTYGPVEQGANSSTMAVLSLSANDTVSCRLRQGTIYGGGLLDGAQFMGYLLG